MISWPPRRTQERMAFLPPGGMADQSLSVRMTLSYPENASQSSGSCLGSNLAANSPLPPRPELIFLWISLSRADPFGVKRDSLSSTAGWDFSIEDWIEWLALPMEPPSVMLT